MTRWRTKPLGDVLKVQNGYAFDSELFTEVPDGMPIIRIRDLARGFTETYFKGSYANKFVINSGDLLIGMDGEFRCYRWPGPPALLNQRICRLHTFNHDIHPSFIFYGINEHLTTIEANTGFSTVKHISSKQIEEIKIPIPPLPEQERIVRILDEAKALRSLRDKIDSQTKELTISLFLEMFGNPLSGSSKWPAKRVSDICDLVRGSSPRPKGDPRYFGGPIPRLMIEDITRDGWWVTPRVDSLTVEGARLSRPVKAGTVVMAVSGTIGLCAQLAVDGCVHDGFVAFTNLDQTLFDSFFFGKAMSLLKEMNTRVQAGAIFQNITTADVKAIEVICPPLPVQQKFAARVAEVRELETAQATSRQRLDDLFQSLLHRAFQGEL